MVIAAGSYPAGRWFESDRRYQNRPHGQAVKTSPFHGGNPSSSLGGVTRQNRPERAVFCLLRRLSSVGQSICLTSRGSLVQVRQSPPSQPQGTICSTPQIPAECLRMCLRLLFRSQSPVSLLRSRIVRSASRPLSLPRENFARGAASPQNQGRTLRPFCVSRTSVAYDVVRSLIGFLNEIGFDNRSTRYYDMLIGRTERAYTWRGVFFLPHI